MRLIVNESIRSRAERLNERRRRLGQQSFRYKEAVYVIIMDVSPPILKIGVSANPLHRLAGLQGATPFPLRLAATLQEGAALSAYGLERQLHKRFAAYRLNGEWFEMREDVSRWVASLPPLSVNISSNKFFFVSPDGVRMRASKIKSRG